MPPVGELVLQKSLERPIELPMAENAGKKFEESSSEAREVRRPPRPRLVAVPESGAEGPGGRGRFIAEALGSLSEVR